MTSIDLKAATLANNVIWLRAFGSDVETTPGLVRVRSSPVASYAGAVAVTRKAAMELVHHRAPFYTDLDAIGVRELETYRYRVVPESCSTIVGGVIRRRLHRGAGIVIEHAANSDAWCTLYARAFHRSRDEAAIDRVRWRRAFASTAVEHWIVIDSGNPIGVFQTVEAHGVVGLYSFGVLRVHRSVRTGLGMVEAIHQLFEERGWTTMYFEVFNRGASASVRAAPRLGLHVIRRMCGFVPS
jgi:hypothetical protein